MKGSEFVLDSVNLLECKLNKVGLNRAESCVDSTTWLKNKKATINPTNNGDKWYLYALNVALNYQNIKEDPQRISKIGPFIDQYDWEEINFPAQQKDWKKSEVNNKTIANNILFVPCNDVKIRLAYKSKYNNKRKNQVILLIINDDKKWHSLAVKSLPALFRVITSKHVYLL